MLALIALALIAAPKTTNYIIYQGTQAIGQEHVRADEDGKQIEGTTVMNGGQFQTVTTYDLRGPLHYQFTGALGGHDAKITIDRNDKGFHLELLGGADKQERDIAATELVDSTTAVHYAHLARAFVDGAKLKRMTAIVPQALGTVEIEISDEGTKVIELHRIPIEVRMLRLQYIGGPMVELAVGNDRTLYRVSVPLQAFVIVADPVSVREYVKTHPTKRGLDPDEIALSGAREKTVSFANDGLTIYGTLTLPKTAGKAPIAILFGGSGPTSRDERIGMHRVLADLAGILAKQGVASLRYDKRYYTYRNIPLGIEGAVTFDTDVLSDAKAAVTAIKQSADVDARQIVLVGLEAGAQAALAMASEAKALILIAPPTTPLDEAMLRQQAHILRARDHAEKDMIDKRLAGLKVALSHVRNGVDDPTVSLSALYLKTTQENSSVHWAEGVKKPVLILEGANDFQVVPSEARGVEAALKAAGSAVTYTEIAKMNHVLREVTVSDGRDYEEAGPVAPAARVALEKFLQQAVQQPR
jgi:dienelactone hydrolase